MGVIDRLLDGDEHDDGVGKRLLEVGQRLAESFGEAGSGPGEGQTMHVSDDNNGGVACVAVKRRAWVVSSRRSTSSTSIRNWNSRWPVARWRRVRVSSRAIATSGVDSGTAKSLTAGRIGGTPDRSRCAASDRMSSVDVRELGQGFRRVFWYRWLSSTSG
jgi:hypothetical protein